MTVPISSSWHQRGVTLRCPQFLPSRFKVTLTVEPIVILLVRVMPFLRDTMGKKAREQLLAREAAKLEKVGYRVKA